jgi:hypothetical protein
MLAIGGERVVAQAGIYGDRHEAVRRLHRDASIRSSERTGAMVGYPPARAGIGNERLALVLEQ